MFIHVIIDEKTDADQREKSDTDRDSVLSEQSIDGKIHSFWMGGCFERSLYSTAFF